MPDERGIVSKSKLTALTTKIKAAAGESDPLTLDEIAALDISGGGGGETIMLSATFDAGENKIFTTDTLDDLKQYLAVVVTVAGQGIEAYPIPSDAYALSGSLSAGSNTITVSALGKTTTFTVSGVIAAVDVTPASWTQSGIASNTQSGIVNKEITVYNTSNGTYKSVYFNVTLESGVFYRLTADAEIHNSNTSVVVALAKQDGGTIILRSDIQQTSGHLVADGLASESANFSTAARIAVYCTMGTSTQGCATYKNVKLIKYSA